METTPVFLTEKEERALQRMERLAELRRGPRSLWRSYGLEVFFAGLLSFRLSVFLLGWALYLVYSGPTTWAVWVLMICGGIHATLSAVFFQVIVPMKRRIESLEHLVEAEIKEKR